MSDEPSTLGQVLAHCSGRAGAIAKVSVRSILSRAHRLLGKLVKRVAKGVLSGLSEGVSDFPAGGHCDTGLHAMECAKVDPFAA